MPKLVLPKDEDEYELWKDILCADKGDTIASVTPKMKWKVRSHFYLKAEKIMCRRTHKPILKLSDLPTLLKEYHDETGHPGKTILFNRLLAVYASVPEREVLSYVKQCEYCKQKPLLPRRLTVKTSKKANLSFGIWSRIDVDLINMNSSPDNGFNWIFHAKDHFSKYTYAKPLKTKECAEVASAIREMLYYFGGAKSLEFGRGGESLDKELQALLKPEFPHTRIVRTKPRHTQANGLIERASVELESRVLAWKMETRREDWSWALPQLCSAKNNEHTRMTGRTPFEMMFGRSNHVDDDADAGTCPAKPINSRPAKSKTAKVPKPENFSYSKDVQAPCAPPNKNPQNPQCSTIPATDNSAVQTMVTPPAPSIQPSFRAPTFRLDGPPFAQPSAANAATPNSYPSQEFYIHPGYPQSDGAFSVNGCQ